MESKMNKEKILANQIRTPDGTILRSRHVHDYVTYTDKNGQHYSVDGGHSYLRRGYDVDDFEELSVYYDENTPHETIREYLERGGRGKDGKQPLKYVLLKDMSTSWVHAVVEYENEHRPNNSFLKHFIKELEYRKDNDIFIPEDGK